MSLYKNFHEKGLCVIPLRRGVPLVEWSRYFNELPNGEVDSWSGNEYALVCGKVSGVIGLDIDTDEPEGQRAYELAGHSPLRKKGSKGFTAFYKWNGEKSTNWKRKDDKSPIIELLSDKRLTTIPPSPHRKTGEIYEWLDGVEGWIDELPELKPDFITLMDALYPKPQRVRDPITYDKNEEPVELSDAEDMLDYISSDCSRDEWINIGMALRDEFGDAACDLFHRWSAKAEDRYNHNQTQSVWRSFTNNGVTIGTIIHHAKQAGWFPRVEAEPEAFTVDLDYINALKKSNEKKEVLQVHGLVGEIAEWITETAIRPQPILSLAAALTFVGMIKGHKVKGSTGLRTNMLSMVLAPSAGGKEWPQKQIRDLFKYCDIDQQLMGEPTSGTGFLRAINDRGRIVMWVMDEMGRFLDNINQKNSGTFQREIIDYMIKSFSCASSILKGREYADAKKNPTIDIIEPHFCCLGSTVLEKFRASCKSTDIVDGFLNRWLVFAVHDRGVVAGKRENMLKKPPMAILEAIRKINTDKEYDAYSGEAILKTVRFTPEAWDIFEPYRDKMDKLIDTTPYPLNALYGRCAEHVEKIALTLCDDESIGVSDVNAAIRVVEYSNSCIMDFAGLIADNESEAEFIKVRDIIKDAKSIKKSDLTRKTQSLKRMRRTEILNDLVESGAVIIEKVGDTTYFTSSFYALPCNKKQ